MLQIKSIPKLTEQAQKVFNAWIRRRDQDKSCISCATGQPEQAGHYLSAGHHGHLRFNEMNVNGQCVRCNLHLHGNGINYRSGLVKRHGENKVLMLEAQKHGIKKWSRAELMAIINFYK
jgi:hypothetical protein